MTNRISEKAGSEVKKCPKNGAVRDVMSCVRDCNVNPHKRQAGIEPVLPAWEAGVITTIRLPQYRLMIADFIKISKIFDEKSIYTEYYLH